MKTCPKCSKLHNNKGKCCSKSCAQKRDMTPEHKAKIGTAVSKAFANKIKGIKDTIFENRICKKCGKSFELEKKKKNLFCSRSCANSRNHSKETKNKISHSLMGNAYNKQNIIPRITVRCLYCGKDFIVRETESHRKFCSFHCSQKGRNRVNSGGYRVGSGRSKSGYYKGIHCGSTYELAYVIYNLDNNIEFERFDGSISLNGKKYFPDFLIGNTIIEIKGREEKEQHEFRIECAKENGYEIVFLYKKDLKHCFQWCEQHYEYKALQELYDDRKPRHTYTCGYCGKEFSSEVKRRKTKTGRVFCSRVCAGSFPTSTGHR